MLEESSSLNPYDFSSRNLNYAFTTDGGTEYFVYFTESTGYFEHSPDLNDHIVSFGFAPRTSKSKAFFMAESGDIKRECILDSRIKDTVLTIIDEFLTTFPEKSLMFVCNDSDGRELCRQRLFAKWHTALSGFASVTTSKYEYEIRGRHTIYAQASIIIRDDHPKHSEVKDVFLSLNEELISKGY